MKEELKLEKPIKSTGNNIHNLQTKKDATFTMKSNKLIWNNFDFLSKSKDQSANNISSDIDQNIALNEYKDKNWDMHENQFDLNQAVDSLFQTIEKQVKEIKHRIGRNQDKGKLEKLLIYTPSS